MFPRRGMFVTSVEIRDLASICEVRLALETHAARLAAERATDADRDEIAALIAELDAGAGPRRACADGVRRADPPRGLPRHAQPRSSMQTLEEYYLLALRIWFLALEQPRELEQAVLEHRDAARGDPRR